jgi:flavin-binding protein dodecin
MSVLKLIEVLAESDKSWEDAAQVGRQRQQNAPKHPFD